MGSSIRCFAILAAVLAACGGDPGGDGEDDVIDADDVGVEALGKTVCDYNCTCFDGKKGVAEGIVLQTNSGLYGCENKVCGSGNVQSYTYIKESCSEEVFVSLPSSDEVSL